MSPRQIINVSYNFSGKVVVITGGGRGQGRSHALAFARAGAEVVIADIGHDLPTVPYALSGQAELDAVKAEIEDLDARCLSVVCDVSDPAQVENLVRSATEEFGKIDILVNNAGIESVHLVQDMPIAAWDEMVAVNLRGAFLCSRAVSAGMIERRAGRIIITGSVSSHSALPRQTHYAAAKHGLLGLTRGLALELGEFGITVNMVCPGAIDTPMINNMFGEDEQEYAAGLGAISGTWNVFDPAAMLDPEEISHAMLWLASDAAAFVTGTSLVVDAGYLTK